MSSSSSHKGQLTMKTLFIIIMLKLSATTVLAYPAATYPGYYPALPLEQPYETKHMNLEEAIAKLKQALININDLGENTKRGLDLGLGRGYSGSQAAKHLMGLAAANFAGGPGRKRQINNGDQDQERPINNFDQ